MLIDQRKQPRLEWDDMADKVTLERETLKAALDALELGRDAAAEIATSYHAAMAGYRQSVHDSLDADVAKHDASIVALRAALAQKAEPPSLQPLPNHDNHHNALKCPYCNPRGLVFVEPQGRQVEEIERLRADLISCRGTVKTELAHYERLAMVHGKTVLAANYEAEAQRLSDLLDRIDAIKEVP